MRVEDYWRPTRAAGERLAELGLAVERREAPNAHMRLAAELPEEFIVLVRGSAACATLVGLKEELAARAAR